MYSVKLISALRNIPAYDSTYIEYTKYIIFTFYCVILTNKNVVGFGIIIPLQYKIS